MENYKVKCIIGNIYFDTGKIYEVINGHLYDNTGCIYSSINYSSVEEINNNNMPQFELYEDTPSKPKLCEILGVEVGERFGISGFPLDCHGFKYEIINNGTICKHNDDGSVDVIASAICDIINNPEKIVRKPKFSDDDKALMRLYVNSGYIYAARDKDNIINMYNSPPTKCTDEWSLDIFSKFYTLPDLFLPQIKWSDSEPFNMAEYLKGLS